MKTRDLPQAVIFALACAALLAGCAGRPAVVPMGASTAPVGGRCDAQGAQALVGQRATAQLVERARVAAGARMARVLRQGQVHTQEVDAERLNLLVDPAGVVQALRCG